MSYDPIGDDDHTDADERKAVVAALRLWANREHHGNGHTAAAGGELRRAADRIEKGEHYKGAPT